MFSFPSSATAISLSSGNQISPPPISFFFSQTAPGRFPNFMILSAAFWEQYKSKGLDRFVALNRRIVRFESIEPVYLL